MRDVLEIGERVCLRTVTAEDVRRVRAWLEDPEIRAPLTVPLLVGALREADWLASLEESPDAIHFAIVLRESGTHIGNCGLHGLGAEGSEAEFGIVVGQKELWGKGYGTEAARLVLRFGFERLGLRRVFLRLAPGNERARRLYEGIGFIDESRAVPPGRGDGRLRLMEIDARWWFEMARRGDGPVEEGPRGPCGAAA